VSLLYGVSLRRQRKATKGKEMGSVGTAELIIILVVLLALFGGKKIPGIARSLGRSLNEFKAGLRDVPSTSDEKSSSESEE